MQAVMLSHDNVHYEGQSVFLKTIKEGTADSERSLPNNSFGQSDATLLGLQT